MAVKRIAFLVFPRLAVMDLVGGYDALSHVALIGAGGRSSDASVGFGSTGATSLGPARGVAPLPA